MKKEFIFITTILLAAGFTPVFSQTTSPSNQKGNGQGINVQYGKFDRVEEDLIKQIKGIPDGMTKDQILQNTRLMNVITGWELIHATGAEHMSELYARDRKYAQFLTAFLKDTDWMQEYLRAGLVPRDTNVGLRILADIWHTDGKSADFSKYRRLATAIASCWGAGNSANSLQEGERIKDARGRTDPLWRYAFFKKSHKEGKLHSNFENLQPWELRFVVGGTLDDASLLYLQENINLPPGQYDSACWFADYRGTSEFGDTIQGPLFYVAWDREKMGGGEQTALHGGVCGALSTLGCTAAASRGIPAYTVGQPGHCAYGYRLERGKWLGGFGGPDGGVHNYIFDGPAPSSTRLMEAVFASDENVAQSHKEASVARALSAAGDTERAKEAWSGVLRAAPLNTFFQRDFQKFAEENSLYSPTQWKQYAHSLLSAYKGHGFAALDALKDVEGKILEAADDDAKLEWFAHVNQALAETDSSWALDVVPVLKSQTDRLQSPDSVEKLLGIALKAHLNTGDGTNFGKALEWAIEEFMEKGKVDTFTKAFASATAGTKGSETGDQKKLKEAYGKAIVAAEKSRSGSAVKALWNAAGHFSEEEWGPKENELDCPDGKLVSDQGYFWTSSTSPWDRPSSHAGVLTKQGGFFHTNNDENPEVIIELPKAVKLSGLLLVKSHSHPQRMKKMKVSRSTDGATWFEVGAIDDMQTQWRIDTPDNPEARWIKVESIVPEKEYFHMRNILIFEK